MSVMNRKVGEHKQGLGHYEVDQFGDLSEQYLNICENIKYIILL